MTNIRLRTICRHSLLSVFLCLASGHAFCQQNSTVEGTVADAKGAAPPNAHVVLTQNGTGFVNSTESNKDGIYTFSGLNVGTYDLTVTAPGFETYKANGIVVNVSETMRDT